MVPVIESPDAFITRDGTAADGLPSPDAAVRKAGAAEPSRAVDRGRAGGAGDRDGLVDGAEVRRRELAAFLRSWRGRLRPEDLGLPAGRRRRTPGLRREEVAELAGVGVTWYTWLEQGRDIHVSAEVVEAVARTLRLDPDEREHLYALSGIDEKPHTHRPVRVTPQLQRIIDALDPYPALVSTARYDVLAWNGTAAAVLADFASLPQAERNLIWLAFKSPAWRTLLVDYEPHVARMVAKLRGGMGRHVGEPWWERFVERLCASSAHFRELWDRREVATGVSCSKRLCHPIAGLLTFDVSTLRIVDQPECELRIWTPSNAASLAAIERLPKATPSRASDAGAVDDDQALF